MKNLSALFVSIREKTFRNANLEALRKLFYAVSIFSGHQ